MTKGCALVGIKVMTGQLTTGYPADSVNEITTVKVLKPVLIRIMGVGLMMEVGGGRVFNPIFITSILEHHQLT